MLDRLAKAAGIGAHGEAFGKWWDSAADDRSTTYDDDWDDKEAYREIVRAVLREAISLRLKYPTEWTEFINDPENWPILNEKSDAQPE